MRAATPYNSVFAVRSAHQNAFGTSQTRRTLAARQILSYWIKEKGAEWTFTTPPSRVSRAMGNLPVR